MVLERRADVLAATSHQMSWHPRALTVPQRLFALSAVCLLPAVAGLIYLIVSVQRERELEVHDLAFRTGQLAALEMESIIGGAAGVLHAVARAPGVRSFSTEACNNYLADVNAQLPQLKGFAVADSEGLLRCGTALPPEPASIADRAHFTQALETGAFVVGQFNHSKVDGVASLPLALAVRDGDRISGVVVAGLDLDWLGDRLGDREFLQGSALTIADREGVIIARQPFPEQFLGGRIPESNQALLRGRRAGTMTVTSQDGARRIIGYFPPAVTGIGLYVSAGVSSEAAFAPIRASTYRSLAIAGVGAIGAFALAWLAGDRLFRRPISRILRTIAAWQRGDTSARTNIPRAGSELAALAGAIDDYMDALIVDREARRKAEAHRALLIREMEHRIKNTLAIVQAVAAQTFRAEASPATLQSFRARLSAMAETHALLLSDNWESADLRTTLETALRPFWVDGEDRVSMTGTAIRITARAALALSMAVHELSTNAAKYGALSGGTGRVSIGWDLRSSPKGERFHFCWTEREGPKVAPPERMGFGSRMMEIALASELHASVALSFPPGGAVFTLDADADATLAGGSRASAA